jgi:predicted nucleotidyltransferase
VLYREEDFGVAALAVSVGVSKGLVSKFLGMLVRSGILIRRNGRFRVKETGRTRALRVVFNICRIDTRVFARRRFVKAVGVYGSCARGANTESSDIDIWIRVTTATDKELAGLTSDVRRKLGRTSIVILTDDKLAPMKKQDPLFYQSLNFGSIIIFGDENAL